MQRWGGAGGKDGGDGGSGGGDGGPGATRAAASAAEGRMSQSLPRSLHASDHAAPQRVDCPVNAHSEVGLLPYLAEQSHTLEPRVRQPQITGVPSAQMSVQLPSVSHSLPAAVHSASVMLQSQHGAALAFAAPHAAPP